MGVIRSDRPIQRLSLQGGERDVASVSLLLSERATSDHRWRVSVEATGGRNVGPRELGRLVTVPPVSGAPVSRVIALCSAPGATDWTVEVEHLSGTGIGEAHLDLIACPYLGGDTGLRALHAWDVSQGQRYWSDASTVIAGMTPIVIPAGIAVHTVTAWLDGPAVGAELSYRDPITGIAVLTPIPSGRSIQLGPRGSLQGPSELGITLPLGATGGYLIEGLQ